MEPEDDQPAGGRDEIPHQSFWAAVPKRSFARVAILLAALLGIVCLREKTASIAGCLSDAFRAPAPISTGARARIELPVDASAKSSR
jgi:hypothetical protein